MPVGLFMNKIETLHTDPAHISTMDQSQELLKNSELFFTMPSTSLHNTDQLNDECFKYFTKLKTNDFFKKSDSNESSTEADELLSLLDSQNDQQIQNNFIQEKYMKVDTILLSPMSIPIDSTSTNNLFPNSIFESTKKIDNFSNNNNIDTINTHVQINANENNNKTTSGFLALNEQENNNSTINIPKNESFQVEVSDLNESKVIDDCQINNGSCQDENFGKLKNSIDFAIDAVVEKCRNDVTTSSDEEMYDLITKSKTLKKSSKKAVKKTVHQLPIHSAPVKVETAVTTITPQHIQPADNSFNSINFSSVESSQATIPSVANQPMSKSSKARTSYISSLIANRRKNSQDEPPAQNQASEDDQQKRISQNILTILANNSHQQQQQQQPNAQIENLQSFTSNNISSKPHKDVQKPIEQAHNQPSSSDIRSNVKTSKKIQKKMTPPPPPVISPTCTAPEMDFVINSFNNQKTLSNNTNNQIVYNDTANFNNSQVKLNSDLTYLDCTNLKRLLAQPSIDNNNLNNEFVNNTNSMKAILMESSFDRIQVDVKVLTNSLNNTVNNNNNINSENNNNMKMYSDNNLTNNNNKDLTSHLQNSNNFNFNSTVPQSTAEIKSEKKIIPKLQQTQQAEASIAEISQTKAAPKRKRPIKTNLLPKTKKTKVNAESSAAPEIKPCQEISKPIEIQNCINIQQPANQSTNEIKNTKTKKLKTIADIVKHNSEAQRNKLLVQTNVPQQQQHQAHLEIQNISIPSTSPSTQNTSFIEKIPERNNNNLPNNNDNITLASSLVNDDVANMNIDQLLEFEFNSVNNTSSNNEQLIDKYIDLDDIDLNPLDCYRNAQSTFTHNLQQPNFSNNTNNNHLDEFNFQFSVCSTSSSGFSEPSNFSTCSSQNSYNNLNNGQNCMFSSESESSPTGNFQYDQNNQINSPGIQQSYNLFQKNVRVGHNAIVAPQMKSHDQNNLTWNISEFTTQNNNDRSLLAHNQINGECSSVSDNMFNNLSFLNDEIKLEI